MAKSLKELQEEAAMNNPILAKLQDSGNINTHKYVEDATESSEVYHMVPNSWMRQENYTINGDPVNNQRG